MKSDMVFIFVSPHLDDVVLSCSGLLRQLVQRGNKVVVATVVTSDDTSQLPPSWLAQRNLIAWGSQERIFSIRCDEDRQAVGMLGAEAVHLGFLDCIFRRNANGDPLYTQRVVNVPVHEHDWVSFEPALQNGLHELICQYPADDLRIVCPLAIGRHVDHVIVRHAVENVSDPRQRIYYEDFPYAQQIDEYRKNLDKLSSRTVSLSDEDKMMRLKAASFYTSQIPGLFPSILDIGLEIARARLPYVGKLTPSWHHIPSVVKRMDHALSEYSAKIGGERYWTYAGLQSSLDVSGHE